MATSRPFVLMTGASGFVGNHTLANFLAHGYRVRIVARNQGSCDRILKVHLKYKDNLETAIVPDITVPGAFDNAVKGVDGIIHMASPFVIKVEDNERDLILPALDGTRGILESARRHGSSIRRIVTTSSFAAVADFPRGLWPGHVYEESQWNPLTYEETKNDRRGLAYA
jgi:nucleoside-diphosphate-sugar epimerase